MAENGIDERRIHVLRNGVDTAMFAPFPRADARRRLGFEERGPLVLAVGNLVPEKGFDLLLHAIVLTTTERPRTGRKPLSLPREAPATPPAAICYNRQFETWTTNGTVVPNRCL